MRRATLEMLQAARAAKMPVALVTELGSGDQAMITAEETSGHLTLSPAQIVAVLKAIVEDKSGVMDAALIDGERDLFVQTFNPPLRLILIGAVHIAQSLVPMAALAGYEVIVVDPRRAWASDLRFPDVTVVHDWPDDALEALAPDRRSAVVALTDDPKLDDPALNVALKADCFYIGALGSRRTHAARLERLTELGQSPEALARIHGPVGLPLGAKSPAEISISILGEITQVRHRAPGAPGHAKGV